MTSLLETRQDLHKLIDSIDDFDRLNEALILLASPPNPNPLSDEEMYAECLRRIENSKGQKLKTWDEVHLEIKAKLAESRKTRLLA